MAKSRGLEKMLGTYQDPKVKWRTNNKEHVSDYNARYFQSKKQDIYQKRAEARQKKSQSLF